MTRKSTGRNRKGVSLSLDNDLADWLASMGSRERNDLMNIVIRNAMEKHIVGNEEPSPVNNEERLRQIIREELSLLSLKATEKPPELRIVNPDDERANSLIDGFLGMRDKK